MKVEFSLKDVLQRRQLYHHGIRRQLANELHLNRHTIASYLNSDVATVSMDFLGKLCGWLQKNNVAPEELLGEFFVARTSRLWANLAGKGLVTVYIGEQQQAKGPVAAWRLLSRRDLAGARLCTQEITAHGHNGKRSPQVVTRYVPFTWDPNGPDILKKPLPEDLARAKKIFAEMKLSSPKSNTLLLGSTKTNYLTELWIAERFKARPFTQATKKSLKVPFYLVYRNGDRKVQSCFGGGSNPATKEYADTPGVHYFDGKNWQIAAWDTGKKDAGIVITASEPGTRTATLIVMGFSGRATEAISQQLVMDEGRFWPPAHRIQGKEIGIYVCRLEFSGSLREDDSGGEIRTRSCEVASLSDSTIRKYLGGD